jgi:uncharacterized surface protein with fasciclin (FAS1) repeats
VKRLVLKAVGVVAAGALLKACGGGGGSISAGGGGVPSGNLTLLQVLQQDGRFSRFLAALQGAGLTDALGQAGTSQTVFAPPDDAFDRLASNVGTLSGGQLADIARFHVVPQFLSSATLVAYGAPGGARPATRYSFGGDAAVLIFVFENNQLNIWDGAGRTSITLTQPDVAASNGVLHVVSDVLLPRHVLTVSQMLHANIDSLFAALVSNEFDGTGPYTVFVPSNNVITGAINVRDHALGRLLGSDNFPTTPTPYMTLSGRTTQLTKGTAPPVLATLTDRTPTPAIVTDVDFFASNGVIHTINKVLVF